MRLAWDEESKKLYETGVDRGVVYPKEAGVYPRGYPWNGLTAVNERPSGAESNALWADNMKYLNLRSAEEFGATIEAYTYPDEFAACDGSLQVATGVYVGQQKRKSFGFAYRTRIGNDVDDTDHGYKVHLLYGCDASPSEKNRQTINDSPEAITFSWEVSTTPVKVSQSGVRPVAHLEIDSTKVDAAKLASFEDILYGTETEEARLPLPDEVFAHFGGEAQPGIHLSQRVVRLSATASAPNHTATLTAETTPADATVTWTSSDNAVVTVSNGVLTLDDSASQPDSAIITASITVDGIQYSDTCTVIVTD